LIAQRFAAQMLSGPPARHPRAVVERLLAVQGQDPRGARLAIRSRSTGLSASDVDRELSQERSLVITWLNRHTLHLVRSEDYPWLHALTTPPLFSASARRLANRGVSEAAAQRGLRAIERALADEGPLTRVQLAERLRAARVPTEGQALVEVLGLSGLHGLTVRGPMIGKQHAYVLVHDWLGEAPAVDREVALSELARRYLAGHGPASDRDLARWAGLPLRDARAGLSAVAGELVERDGLVDLKRRARARGLPAPKLLGAFDPVLLGWAARGFLTGGHGERIMRGGMFRPFALVDGTAAALWRVERGSVRLEPLRRLGGTEKAALEEDARDVERFLAA
jgi:hypothetical protein